MRLVTPYSPGTFLKPCLVIDTMFNTNTKETALKFVEAGNSDHALAFGGDHAPRSSGWVAIQQHQTKEEAIAFHLKLAEPFCNGGSEEEWNAGQESYLVLYERWCPTAFRKRWKR